MREESKDDTQSWVREKRMAHQPKRMARGMETSEECRKTKNSQMKERLQEDLEKLGAMGWQKACLEQESSLQAQSLFE